MLHVTCVGARGLKGQAAGVGERLVHWLEGEGETLDKALFGHTGAGAVDLVEDKAMLKDDAAVVMAAVRARGYRSPRKKCWEGRAF
jgi:hypothetical protein